LTTRGNADGQGITIGPDLKGRIDPMSSTTSIPGATVARDLAPAPTSWPAHDQRTVFRGVGWETYESLSRAQGEGDHVRLAYDGKDLEIMTTSNLHENLKGLAGKFIDAVASWSRIAYVSSGEATLNAVDAKRGLQADQSYCFEPEKVRMAREALARGSMAPDDYPKPDLAVEIDISPSQVDRPGIYAALHVPEIWRLRRGGTVVIEHLQPDGSYAPAEASRFLPVRAEEIHAWLTAEDVSQEDAWYRRLQEWAMARFRQA
jgi:Uma2 family endonuclease